MNHCLQGIGLFVKCNYTKLHCCPGKFKTPSIVILGHRAEDPEGYRLSHKFNALYNTDWILGSEPEDCLFELCYLSVTGRLAGDGQATVEDVGIDAVFARRHLGYLSARSVIA